MRLGTPTSAYLDANVVTQFIEGDNQKLLFLIENAASELMRLYTSELTLSEVLVGPLKSGNIRLARIYDEFLTSDEILEVGMHRPNRHSSNAMRTQKRPRPRRSLWSVGIDARWRARSVGRIRKR